MNINGIDLIIEPNNDVALVGGATITGFREVTIDHRLAMVLGMEFINFIAASAAAYFDLGHHIEAEGDQHQDICGYRIYYCDAKAKSEMTYLAAKYGKDKIVEYMKLKDAFIASNLYLDNMIEMLGSNKSGVDAVAVRDDALALYRESTAAVLAYI